MACANQTTRRIGTAHHWPGDPVLHRTRTHAQHLASVAAYRLYHQNNGYCDLAYNDCVCPCGFIIPGRTLSKRAGANGNRTLNEQYAALLWLLGPGEAGTAKQVAAAEAWHRRVGGVKKAHKDIRPGGTACPGPWVTSWVRGAVAPDPEEDDMAVSIIKRQSNGSLAVYDGTNKWRIGSNTVNYVLRSFPNAKTVIQPDWFWDAVPDAGDIEFRVQRYLDSKNSETLELVRDLPRSTWAYANPEIETRDAYQILRDIDAKESTAPPPGTAVTYKFSGTAVPEEEA